MHKPALKSRRHLVLVVGPDSSLSKPQFPHLQTGPNLIVVRIKLTQVNCLALNEPPIKDNY